MVIERLASGKETKLDSEEILLVLDGASVSAEVIISQGDSTETVAPNAGALSERKKSSPSYA